MDIVGLVVSKSKGIRRMLGPRWGMLIAAVGG